MKEVGSCGKGVGLLGFRGPGQIDFVTGARARRRIELLLPVEKSGGRDGLEVEGFAGRGVLDSRQRSAWEWEWMKQEAFPATLQIAC